MWWYGLDIPNYNCHLLEEFLNECRKTKTKPITHQLDYPVDNQPVPNRS